MAKSSRSSTKKENNRRKATNVFGPAESARAERLSAKLLELAKQPKPDTSDVNMEVKELNTTADEDAGDDAAADNTGMDVDSKITPKRSIMRKRIDKRKQKKSSIAFTKYSDRLAAKKKKKSSA